MTRTYSLRPKALPTAEHPLLRDLNAQQRAVVLAGGGALLVIAGAGSGKTRTLTRRVAYLIEQKVSPDRILLLTFTNKAAREMLRRVAESAAGSTDRIWGGTFHHIGHRILRQHAPLVGFPSSFGIMDGTDAEDLMSQCLIHSGLSESNSEFPGAGPLHRIHSMSVNTCRSIAQTLETHMPHLLRWRSGIEQVLLHYNRRKHEMGLMDYDDLLLRWLQLFTEHPEIAEAYAARFEHVLVDEYQDTNALQGRLVDLCASHHRNLTVVGDDCQSIYSFRGADFTQILQFPQRHEGCQCFLLELNYRSTPPILALANASIAFNRQRFDKTLRPAPPNPSDPAASPSADAEAERPACVPALDPTEQAAFVAQRIRDHLDDGIPPHEIAVLYRAHHQSLQLQLELTRQNIPFALRSGLRFFELAHVKDLLAFLRFATNPRDELSFLRLARLCDGIGPKIAQRLWSLISADAPDPDTIFVRLASPAATKSAGARAKVSVERLTRLIADLRTPDPNQNKNPGELISLITDRFCAAHIQKVYDNPAERLEDLNQLAAFAAPFISLAGFLSELALYTSTEDLSDTPTPDSPDPAPAAPRLVLSSVHQAKGLEWQVVFVTSLTEGAFPIGASLREPAAEEEERRLFYVAITRARRALYLTYPQMSIDRRGLVNPTTPSRFLREVQATAPHLLEVWSLT